MSADISHGTQDTQSTFDAVEHVMAWAANSIHDVDDAIGFADWYLTVYRASAESERYPEYAIAWRVYQRNTGR